MWILFLHQICVQCRSKGVKSKVIYAKKCRKTNPSHTSKQRSLLRIYAVWENSLITAKVDFLVFCGIISLLKDGHVVCATFMKQGVAV